MASTYEVIPGARFNSIVVLETWRDSNRIMARYNCDCGRVCVTSASNIATGNTSKCRSCGGRGRAISVSDGSTKVCARCRVRMPIGMFGADKRRADGKFPWCRMCRAKVPDRLRLKIINHAMDLRRCSTCQRWLPRDSFYRNRATSSGLHMHCKKCSGQAARDYTRRNVDLVREKMRAYSRRPDVVARRNAIRALPSRKEKERHWRATSAAYRAGLARANAKRRQRVISADTAASLTDAEWRAILDRQDNRCACCGRTFALHRTPQRDHIKPVAHGYGLTATNCQALCKPCNTKKGTKHYDYRRWHDLRLYMERLGAREVSITFF